MRRREGVAGEAGDRAGESEKESRRMAGDWRTGVVRSVREEDGEKRRGTDEGSETTRCWMAAGVGLQEE